MLGERENVACLEAPLLMHHLILLRYVTIAHTIPIERMYLAASLAGDTSERIKNVHPSELGAPSILPSSCCASSVFQAHKAKMTLHLSACYLSLISLNKPH